MMNQPNACTSVSCPPTQRGAVLIVALVMLTVLTFIAVTALNTSGIEEKMAGNTQERFRAFQTAETGLSATYADPAQFVLTKDSSLTDCGPNAGAKLQKSGVGSYNSNADVCTEFLMWSAPPRGSGYSATQFSAAHFEMVSTGETSTNAQVVLHAGAFQIAPGGS